jgi:hypothetical protein
MTVDLRFFDFPLAAVFLLFGMAVGWADRSVCQQRQAFSEVERHEGVRR